MVRASTGGGVTGRVMVRASTGGRVTGVNNGEGEYWR